MKDSLFDGFWLILCAQDILCGPHELEPRDGESLCCVVLSGLFPWPQRWFAQHNRTLMSPLQLYNAAIFAFGNDAAIRSEAEALHQAAVTHLQAETGAPCRTESAACTLR